MKTAGATMRASIRLSRGFSLVEIMVALVIGLVLIGGAMQVYVNSRASYVVNEGTARLQETARYALSVLEPDIRMAGNWGLAASHLMINGRQPQPTAANPLPTLISNQCGYNFAVDLSSAVQGNNNGYVFGVAPIVNCGAYLNDPRASSDTLTLRHASLIGTAPPGVARFQLCTNRGGLGQQLASPIAACAAPSQLNDLIVNGYYVANQSDPNSGGATMPSLRRQRLRGGAAAVFIDEEVIEGVEDFQVQFGIDPGIVPAIPVPNAPLAHCGLARFYVNPGATPAATPEPQIVSVRIWLLVRSAAPEVGFIDNTVYQYADRLAANGSTAILNNAAASGQAFAPAGNAQLAQFRRLLVSRTFQLRNAEAIESLATSATNPCP